MKTRKRFIAPLLALLILLSAGCTQPPVEPPAPTPTPEPSFPPLPAIASALPADVSPDGTAFQDMAYARPDVERIGEWMYGVALRTPYTEDFRTLLDWAHTAERLYSHVLTMRTLAMLHSAMDKSDAYWLEEYNWISTESISLYYEYEGLRRTLLEHPDHEGLAAVLPEDFFYGLDAKDADLEILVPLYEREQSLMNEYAADVATAAVEFQGESLTLNDMYLIPDYDGYAAAMGLWYDAHQARLAERYIELVRLRREIAGACGYESYAHYVFAVEGRDYSPEMMAEHTDALAAHLAPAYTALRENYGAMYYPDVELPLPECSAFLLQALEDLDGRLVTPMLAMEAYGLSDLEQRPFKEGGAFTAYIQDYASPFLFLAYEGDHWSITTLAHEYGHFLDYYLMPEKAHMETLDTAEIYSQAMELLIANRYEDVFSPADAYMLRYDTLSQGFQVLLSQPYYTALELAVFALPDEELTVESINRIAFEEARRFGLTDEEDSNFYGEGWVDVPHLFESPFYTFTYATSMDVALQVWEISLYDEADAVKTYMDLLARKNGDAFLENILAAGLKSPFAPGRAEELAALCGKYLVEEDWEAEEREAA